jgi:hypothetical protein
MSYVLIGWPQDIQLPWATDCDMAQSKLETELRTATTQTWPTGQEAAKRLNM